jgi:cysteinyl-tRNA synthetase
MALRFHNSLTRRIDEFVPLTPGEARLYTCGPTVYNYAHIGNFRAYVFEDLLRRTLAYCGFRVRQVMNLTDVDDKTIRDSRRAGLPLGEFTRKYKDAFFEDIEELRIEPAEFYPAATDHIPEMIALIRTLMDKGIAYQAEDGSVYFSIARFPRYGQLSRIRPEDTQHSVSRVSHDEYAKESVADFALWKAHDPGDGDVAWDSPWGRGRPGWHIECSAMSMKYLGPQFDIHTGGVDNMFPHHEDEIAQSEAANGCRFVNYWLHCAHLMVDGGKMSKSAGNFHTLRDIIDRGFTGREVRYVLLGAHYRQSLNFSFRACEDARASLQRLDDFVQRVREVERSGDRGGDEVEAFLDQAGAGFRQGLEDDLNISAALAALFNLVREVNRVLDRDGLGGAAATAVLDRFRRFDRVLAVLDVDREEAVPAPVLAMAEERQAARKARDFQRADVLRDALRDQGWVVEDTPSGPRVKRL